MRKKVLFVMSSMDNGGAERALLNLIEELPVESYDIDLMLLNPSGLFMDQIPAKANLLETPPIVAECFTSIRGRKARIWRVAADMISMLVSRDEETRRGFRWEHFFAPRIEGLSSHYNTAVAFINGQVLYFVAEKVAADRKIVFYHGDYNSAHYSEKYERPRLEQMDGIYAVSEKCIDIVASVFPELSDKMSFLPNIVSSSAIRARASEFVPQEYGHGKFVILTVARITHEKGVDLAIKAAAELKSRGCIFHWYEMGKGLVGDGEAEKCKRLIEELGVSDVFTMIGAKDNPYPYIVNSDIVVQPSRLEGKSVALDEAKILGRPIVATSYPTVRDQLKEGEGIIVDIDPIAIADGIELLVNDKARRVAISKYLLSNDYGNSQCVADYRDAIDGGRR